MNIINKSQFRKVIKQVIRECLEERIQSLNENANLDKIVGLVMKKNVNDPQKVTYLVTQLYKHQYNSEPDAGEVASAIEKHSGLQEACYEVVAPKSSTDAKEDKARKIQTEPKVNENNWIKKAVNPDHKGYCTPMTKSTCTPTRKALAQRFKKGDIHKDNVDETAYKTQGPSAKTFEDSPQLPDAQNDPRNA